MRVFFVKRRDGLDDQAIVCTTVFYFTTEFHAVGFKVSVEVVRHRVVGLHVSFLIV